MKVKCPKCGGFDKAPDEYAGKKIRCPACAWEYPAAAWIAPPAVKGKTQQPLTVWMLLYPALIGALIMLAIYAAIKFEFFAEILGGGMILIVVFGLPILAFYVIVSLIRWIFRVDEKAEYLRKIAERDNDRRP